MIGFVYQMHEAGIPISIQYVIDFYRALEKRLVSNLDQLFLLARLIFVKKLEHFDIFEQVFASFFFGRRSGDQEFDWEEFLASKPLQEWLRAQIDEGHLDFEAVREMEPEELLRRFWETLLKQRGEHRGGSTWVGTGGQSLFGHGGHEAGGLRVYGQALYGTAQQVIGNRNYINYSDSSALSAENLRQVLTSLKSLRPLGPLSELDIDATIANTARNGGEIELIFRRELRNRTQLIVLLDNGGYSMMPYVSLVRTVFNKIRDLFKEVKFYYFHNCIYGQVYRDSPRTRPLPWEKLLNEDRNTRLIIIGDANMAPAELMAAYGSLGLSTAVRKPGWEWLLELKKAFPASVWLNPIPRDSWERESTTIRQIQRIFHMEDLTLGGIKNAVNTLNIQGQPFDTC
jgi:uncharacterized protein with von Willebrand factor type A (vWA) domain